jgi:hypothetical protein
MDAAYGRHAKRSSFEPSELSELAFGHSFDPEKLAGAPVERSSGLGESDAACAALEE